MEDDFLVSVENQSYYFPDTHMLMRMMFIKITKPKIFPKKLYFPLTYVLHKYVGKGQINTNMVK